jgi:hypothetical protein
MSCRTGTLTPGGRHFVRYYASRGVLKDEAQFRLLFLFLVLLFLRFMPRNHFICKILQKHGGGG